MKYSTPLINLAILETLKTETHRNEIDLFIPYIAISVKNLSNIPFGSDDLKQQLLSDFGIDAPSAAVDVLLARARHRKLVRLENHVFFPVAENISPWLDQYKSQSDNVERSIDLITDEFVCFSKDKYHKELGKDEALSLVFKFLRDNLSDSAMLAFGKKTNELNEIKNTGHLTASFIAHVHKSKVDLWPYFEMIARAVMLAGYLTYADQISEKKDYSNFSVYLDTPIVLGLLGYSGDSKSRTFREMLAMLLKHGVDVCIFYETQREIEGILSAWANDLSVSRCDRFNPKTLELLRHKGIDSAAIETRIVLLEKDIKSLGIKIPLGFKFDTKFSCDVSGLEEKIRNEFRGKWVDPRHDADVISKIHNLRRGEVIKSLNQRFSIFITPNTALVDISKDFFGVGERCIPYAATDKWLTTMFWFKNPGVFKELPEKMVLTCAYGTMFSDNGFWKKFSDRLEALKSSRDISEDDFILVRYDSDLLLRVHEISVDKGMDFSDKDIFEVVELVKEKLIGEKDREIHLIKSDSSEKLAAMAASANIVKNEYSSVISRLERIVNLVSTILGWVVFVSVVVLVGVVTFYSIPKEIIGEKIGEQHTQGALYVLIFIFSLLVDFVGKIFGLSIHDIRIGCQSFLARWLTDRLIKP